MKREKHNVSDFELSDFERMRSFRVMCSDLFTLSAVNFRKFDMCVRSDGLTLLSFFLEDTDTGSPSHTWNPFIEHSFSCDTQ